MKFVLLFLALLMAPGLHAETQDQVMTECQAEAKEKGIAGKNHNDYIKECLGTKAVADDGTSTRMGECTLHAAEKSLQGNDKKQFMQACMAGSH